jgi:hypothetical protein
VVTLRHAGRNILVESREDGAAEDEGQALPEDAGGRVLSASTEASADSPEREARRRSDAVVDTDTDEDALPASPMTMQDGIRAVQKTFGEAATPPRWPLYVRQARQFLRGAVEGFDERNYGFTSVVDLLRAAGKEGVLRIERDRHGAVRIFPGAKLTPPASSPVDADGAADVRGVRLHPSTAARGALSEVEGQPDPGVGAVVEPPIVEAEPFELVEPAPPGDDGTRGTRRRRREGGTPARGKAVKSTRPRTRKTVRTKEAAADSRE